MKRMTTFCDGKNQRNMSSCSCFLITLTSCRKWRRYSSARIVRRDQQEWEERSDKLGETFAHLRSSSLGLWSSSGTIYPFTATEVLRFWQMNCFPSSNCCLFYSKWTVYKKMNERRVWEPPRRALVQHTLARLGEPAFAWQIYWDRKSVV